MIWAILSTIFALAFVLGEWLAGRGKYAWHRRWKSIAFVAAIGLIGASLAIQITEHFGQARRDEAARKESQDAQARIEDARR